MVVVRRVVMGGGGTEHDGNSYIVKEMDEESWRDRESVGQMRQ